MGNILEQLIAHKTELALIGGILASFYYLIKEKREKDQLTKVILSLVESKNSGVKEFESALNQVYLKDPIEHYSIRNTA